MFDPTQQFYPTPKPVASKVWRKVKELLRRNPDEACDPSGGKGDLLQPALDLEYHNVRCYAIEIDPDLRLILQGKKITVLGTDFLEFSDPIQFECVVVNPPFKIGVHYVLKAWELVLPKGVIVGLLNAETLNNPGTAERRRLLSLIEEHGGWESLGNCFKDAERSTDVDVAMFWMQKPKVTVNPNEFKFSGDFQPASPETFEEFAANPLASCDAIDSLVGQYRVCLSLLKTRSQVQSELNYHLSSLVGSSKNGKNETAMTFDFSNDLTCLKYRLWKSVFAMTNLGDIKTSDFVAKYNAWVKNQVEMEFNRSNILEALSMFFQSREQIIIDSICSIFDRATAYHPDNKIHGEGWKTNTGSKVTERIIIPCGVSVNHYFDTWQIPESTFFDDLDRVLCRLAGQPDTEAHGLTRAIKGEKATEYLPGKWQSLRWYDVKLHRKGTVHLRFPDLYLLEDLNAIVGRERKWIGGAHGG